MTNNRRRIAMGILALAVFSTALAAKAPELILQVNNVKATKITGGVRVHVDGTASTPGWTKVTLKLKSSAGGKLAYDLIGTPPDGIVPQVLTPVKADATWKGKTRIREVTVTAKTNKKTAKVK